MGTDLHHSVIKFFEDRMFSHDQVEGTRRMPVQDEVIYEISRRKFGDVVRVWLSDAYRFAEGDFLNVVAP